jgi:DNA-binding MarR family transcriptional regulator
MPLGHEPDDPRAPTVDALRELILAAENYRHRVADYFGIGVTETAAISYLFSRGDLGQTELARHLGITTSTTTSLIDRLEANGLAVRIPHPGDRRRTTIQLSEAGHRAVHESRHWFRAALDGVADRDLARATKLLTSVAEGLRTQADAIPVSATS